MFVVWTLLLSVPFLFLCCGIGSVLVLIFVRWVPRGPVLRIAGAVAAIAGVALLYVSLRFGGDGGDAPQFRLSRIIPGLRLAGNPLVPGYWFSEGIMSLTRGQWARGGMLACALPSSALLMFMVFEWVGTAVFYECWQLATSGSGRRAHGSRAFVVADRALGFLPRDMRAMLMKDLRGFFRDPVQWSQALIFFGLLAMYFAHLRSFNYHELGDGWRTAMVFLNLFSVASVMCSMAARFSYPQLSLEGHGFWILGLSPASMRRILLTKFAGSAVGLVSVSVGLTLLSSVMLGTEPGMRTTLLFIAAAVALALSGMSNGLGAAFIDLRERNPAAIVSGFGGTLNLVMSLAFMLAVILPFGMLYFLRATEELGLRAFRAGLAVSSVWLVLVTLAATVVPLAAGYRSLRTRDF